MNKVHSVGGDVSLPDLGLSLADKTRLIENVNIVFHAVAMVRFNEPFNVNVNIKGNARNGIVQGTEACN